MADQVTGNVETPPVVAPVAPAPAADAGDSSQTDVNTQKQVPLAALQEERDRNRELRAQIDALNRVVSSTSGIPTAAPGEDPTVGGFVQNPTPTHPTHMQAPAFQAPQISKEELDRLWMDDPRKAMETTVSMALNWYDQVGAQVDYQESALQRQFKDFPEYRESVRNYIRQLPPEHRAKPGVVEMAYYVVRGQSFDKTVASKEAELLRKIRAGESVQGYTGTLSTSAAATAPTQISATEAEIALKMGMTPAEYLANKK